jgi:hypothetical protein
MKISIVKLIVAIGLSQAVFVANGQAAEQVQSSPREFCRTTGGSVGETADEQIFICCYEQERGCVLNNERERLSRRISTAAEQHAPLVARENRGGWSAE